MSEQTTDRPKGKRGPKPDPNSVTQIKLAKRVPRVFRPTEFDQDIALELCSRISIGELLHRIVEDKTMPTMKTVYRWMVETPAFGVAYARARVDACDAKVAEMESIAHDPASGASHEAVAHARLKIDTIKWIVSKLQPGKYGDKLEVQIDPIFTTVIRRFSDVQALTGEAVLVPDSTPANIQH